MFKQAQGSIRHRIAQGKESGGDGDDRQEGRSALEEFDHRCGRAVSRADLPPGCELWSSLATLPAPRRAWFT
jgi:hypothetical protein